MNRHRLPRLSRPLVKSAALMLGIPEIDAIQLPTGSKANTFMLTIEGFEVRSYASPMELLNDVNFPAFHCLIVDFHMPEMDGLGVVEKLRERKNYPRAILVTSHPNIAMRERAAKLEVPVVVKPFRGTELVDAIHTA